MKRRIHYPLYQVGIALLLMFSISCKKDNAPVPLQKGSFKFRLLTIVDADEIRNYSDTFTMTSGRRIVVNQAQLYISNIKLIKTDGTVIDGPANTIFQRQGVTDYSLDQVYVGNYRTIRFDVGLNDAVNASNPPSTNLTLCQPSMWYGSSAQPDGFIFVNFSGSIDTSDAINGVGLTPFSYKIGTNIHRITVTMPVKNFSVSADQETVIQILSDYSKLFTDVQLNDSSNLNINSIYDNSLDLADHLTENIPLMFRYQ